MYLLLKISPHLAMKLDFKCLFLNTKIIVKETVKELELLGRI